jgi:hypothetical protein
LTVPSAGRHQNEELRHFVNRAIADVGDRFAGDGAHVFRFLCECNRDECREVIELTVADYRALGASHRRLVVAAHFDQSLGLVEAVGRDVYAIPMN